MEITYIPRIVFELKYDFMLDFAQSYPSLLGPFVRLAKTLSILNEGKLNETLRLDFVEDKFRIEVGPENMILVTEGECPLPLFAHATAPGKIFFEILEKLRKEETFGNFKHLLLLMECFLEIEGEKEEIVEKLQSSYLNANLLQPKNSPRAFDLNFGFNQGDGFNNLHVMYFDSAILQNSSTDLFLFSTDRALDIILRKSKGMLLGYTFFEKNISKVDLRLFREFSQVGFEHLKTILAHGKF